MGPWRLSCTTPSFYISMRVEFEEIRPRLQYSEAREICGMFKEGFQIRMKEKRGEVSSVLK